MPINDEKDKVITSVASKECVAVIEQLLKSVRGTKSTVIGALIEMQLNTLGIFPEEKFKHGETVFEIRDFFRKFKAGIK